MAASKQKGYKLGLGNIIGKLQVYILYNPATTPSRGYFLCFDVGVRKVSLEEAKLTMGRTLTYRIP